MVKNEYIYLIWQDPKSRRKLVVGELKKDNGYKFVYTKEFEEAKKLGWGMLKPFPEEKEYRSESLFPVFNCRLPDPKRRDIKDILKEYGMYNYDEFELLKKTGAKLPIDTYEFIDPIFPEDKNIVKEFYLSGVRHVSECDGVNCLGLNNSISVDENLILKPEPENKFDKYAVMVSSEEGRNLGYIPRYYSEQVSLRLSKNFSYECTVTKIDYNEECRDCIQVRLKIPKNCR